MICKVFDPEQMCDNFSMIVFAKRRSGKSYMISEIINKISDRFDYIIVKSNVDESCEFFKNTIKHNSLLCSKYVLHDKVLEFTHNKKNKKKILIIMDDIQSVKSTRYDETVSKLFVSGRHKNISCILINQNFTLMSRQIRENADYVTFFKNGKKTYDYVIESFLMDNDISDIDFKNETVCKRHFKQFFKELFKIKYQSCVIDSVKNEICCYLAE